MGSGPTKRRFDQIFTEGKRSHGRLFRVIALPGTGSVGYATAKKIGSHAQRNRVRRRARAAFDQMGFSTHLDILIVAGVAAAGVGIAEMREELGTLLRTIEGKWAEDSEFS